MPINAFRISIASLALATVGCATQVQLPANAKTTGGGSGGTYLDGVDFSYIPERSLQFSDLKLCVIENVTNNTINLRDSAGSFVGPATGRYYQSDSRQSVAGGQVFKLLDEPSATLVATGVVSANTGLLVRDHIRFDLKASSAGPGATLVLYNISRAQESTGILANDGFQPVGVWPGSRAPEVYSALEGVAAKIKTCMRQ